MIENDKQDETEPPATLDDVRDLLRAIYDELKEVNGNLDSIYHAVR